MGRLFKPWRIVGVSITESELSDSTSNILHHFMVAYSQSNELPLKDRPCASHLKNTVLRTEKQLRHWFASFQDSISYLGIRSMRSLVRQLSVVV